MTCFWDGILSKLALHNINQSLHENLAQKPGAHQFAVLLKKHAVRTSNVAWNEEKLSDKMLEENLEWVRSLDPNGIGYGYDCSACDPFLILVAELFRANIVHHYNGITINYHNEQATQTLTFGSNWGHFW